MVAFKPGVPVLTLPVTFTLSPGLACDLDTVRLSLDFFVG